MSTENSNVIDVTEAVAAINEDVSSPGPSTSTPAAEPISRAVTTSKNWLTELVTGAVEAYSKELKDSPIRTKALTSCAISMLGELIGTALKPRKPDGTRGEILN